MTTTRRSLIVAAALVVALGLGVFVAGSPQDRPERVSAELPQTDPVPPIYALPEIPDPDPRHPKAVAAAVRFLEAMQPDGTYVRSRAGSSAVAPMDVAHAAIALVSVNRVGAAEAAMTWLYRQITLPGSPDAIDARGVDYSGSWYDDLQTDGRPEAGSARGRGEGVGMALIATYAIDARDPGYLNTRIGDHRVANLVGLATDYLTRPTMLAPDGRFYHSPAYRVSFNEECARMTLGLDLAGRMLNRKGNVAVDQISIAATEGQRALDRGSGLSQGMAYDFYARSIWGLASPAEARQELAWTRSTGLVSANGVKNWDWQLTTAATPLTWLRWWAQARTIAPSQTFDYAIAAINAGDLGTALDLERRWLPLQRADGGFDDALVFGPFGSHVGFDAPTSYAVARFILLERLLDVVAPAR
ncbi:MAG: hypothetical protein ACRDIY_22890 [Chloroflexota bacterium]